MTLVHKGNLIELAVQTEMGLQVNFPTELLVLFPFKNALLHLYIVVQPSLLLLPWIIQLN